MNDDCKPIYLDYAATTPVDPRVIERMIECLGPGGCFANPASSSHAPGREARNRVEAARRDVAAMLGAVPPEIIWTSGATESNNLAIKGAARFHADRGRHIVTSRTEHKAVLDTCRQLEKEGWQVTYVTPGPGGIVGPAQVEAALRPDTVLVSVMYVNNEIGTINDVAAIGALCRERGVLFHIDAAQAAGKLPLRVDELCADLLSLSGHKVYGPKGIGALYLRGSPKSRLEPLIHGGGHEWGMRSGTLATHQIVGMGEAFRIATAEQAAEAARLVQLRRRLWDGIASLGGVHLNGDPERRVAGILNVCFEGVEGESLLFALRELAVSSGSACTSASREASYVLRALGRDDQLAQSSLRFSVGRFTTAEDVDRAAAIVRTQVQRLRSLGPDGSEAQEAAI
ncbi:IscS subfamily cysteine desulfurase [Thioalkalivibrio sp. XN279]|uniref:IscS subfamily cysteine desulfurase n=1 Tax=Thioalkalivibrio sp. XN279 TaxID=2714953 RepID=UPI00140C6CC5|nr:IscS subfamily cysteine desulfurase [Thioalkalivibrio sp. XN279]NHA15632.1 IscS subfamily cysteine desulfurase [Thioalkalivibrio sp. XN279]